MPTTYEIHPAIGIARVGNSTDPNGFFVGADPEVPPPAQFWHRRSAPSLR